MVALKRAIIECAVKKYGLDLQPPGSRWIGSRSPEKGMGQNWVMGEEVYEEVGKVIRALKEPQHATDK